MLQETEDYSSPQVQLSLPKTVLEEVSKLAIIAWKQLPSSEIKTSFLSNIKQAAMEPYEEFVAKLEENISKMITNPEVADILLKQLAFEKMQIQPVKPS